MKKALLVLSGFALLGGLISCNKFPDHYPGLSGGSEVVQKPSYVCSTKRIAICVVSVKVDTFRNTSQQWIDSLCAATYKQTEYETVEMNCVKQ